MKNSFPFDNFPLKFSESKDSYEIFLSEFDFEFSNFDYNTIYFKITVKNFDGLFNNFLKKVMSLCSETDLMLVEHHLKLEYFAILDTVVPLDSLIYESLHIFLNTVIESEDSGKNLTVFEQILNLYIAFMNSSDHDLEDHEAIYMMVLFLCSGKPEDKAKIVQRKILKSEVEKILDITV